MIDAVETKDRALLARAFGVPLRVPERDAVVGGAVCEELRYAERQSACRVRELVGLGIVPEELLRRVVAEALSRGLAEVADSGQAEDGVSAASGRKPERKMPSRRVAHCRHPVHV